MDSEDYIIIGFGSLKELVQGIQSLRLNIIEYERQVVKHVLKDINIISTGVLYKYIIIDNNGAVWSRLSKKNDIADPEGLILSGDEPLICSRHMIYEMLKELSIEMTMEDRQILNSFYKNIDSLRWPFGELYPLMIWLKDVLDELKALLETFKSLNDIVPMKNGIKIEMPLIKKLLEFREQLYLYLNSIQFLTKLLKVALREYSYLDKINIRLLSDSALFNLETHDYLEFYDVQLWSVGSRYNPIYKTFVSHGYGKDIGELKLDERFLSNMIEIFHSMFYREMVMNKSYYEPVLRKLNDIQIYDILNSFLKFERIIKNENLLRFARSL